jgi:hypothetical protein
VHNGAVDTKHRPLVEPLLSPKYDDDETLSVADWDGTVRLGCTCGWTDSRISIGSGLLADAWREHVTADMAGVDYRGHS